MQQQSQAKKNPVPSFDNKQTSVNRFHPASRIMRRSPNTSRKKTGTSKNKNYLTKEQEIELAKAWHEHGDIEARNKLVMSHIPLARNIISNNMKRINKSYDDLLNEAILGLIKTVDKFDPGKGNRFSTYAMWWIKSFVQEAMVRDNSSVRLKMSSSNRNAFFNLQHMKRDAENKLRNRGILNPQEYEIDQELCDILGVDENRLNEIRSAMQSTTSLNTPIGNDEGGTLEIMDTLVSDSQTAEEKIAKDDNMAYFRSALEEAFKVLNSRELYVIKTRTQSTEKVTLDKISIKFGVTRERVRQIEARAKEKMRLKLESMGISGFDDIIPKSPLEEFDDANIEAAF